MQRSLRLGSYQTAWTILHRLRPTMVEPERDKLSDIVEVDKIFFGRITPKTSTKNQ
tara:strand:+ start:456 stop:623 length:168 start_codon:yes stop_codon:yes gene_type:complete